MNKTFENQQPRRTNKTKLVPSIGSKILMCTIGLALPFLFGWALFKFWNQDLSTKIIFSLFLTISICLSFCIIRLAFFAYIEFGDETGLAYWNTFTAKTVIPCSDLIGCSKIENEVIVWFEKVINDEKKILSTGFSTYYEHLNQLIEWVKIQQMVSEPMNENEFWNIINRSKEDSSDQFNSMVNILKKLPFKKIVSFLIKIEELLYDSYNEKLWCAAYLVNKGCPDDEFEFFRLWLISQGKETFYSVLNTPDSLIDFIPENNDSKLEFENLLFAADAAATDYCAPSFFINYEKCTKIGTNYPDLCFSWNDKHPESLKQICPRLFMQYYSI